MGSKTLPALIKEASDIANLLAETGGEITPEIEAIIDQNGVELSAKVDAYWFVMQELEARASYAKMRSGEWDAAGLACAKAYDSMKERIHHAMKSLDLPEIQGREVLFRRQANPPKVVIDDEKKIPGSYFVSEVKTTLDKKKLGEDLKSGQEVAGAHIERGERIVAKVAASPKIKAGSK